MSPSCWIRERAPFARTRIARPLAALRRCKTLEEIIFTPQYQKLYRQLGDKKIVQEGNTWRNREGIAAVAGILAHVKKTSEVKTVAEHFAQTKEDGGKTPLVSESRFMRLVKIKSHAELYPALIRLIHLAGDSAPLTDLIKSVYWWNDKTRREWTFGYFEKLP